MGETYFAYSDNDYLVHYGVMGMKWGVRRYQNNDGTLTNEGRRRYGSGESFKAKKEYKAAKKQYNRDFNYAYARSGLHITKKGREADEKRWEKVYDSANKLDEAKSKYRITKAEDKEIARLAKKELRDKAREIQKSDKSMKYAYNYKTAERAAKNILDKNMDYKDAVREAKGTAWKNTAVLLAAYSAVTVAEIVIAKKQGII